MGASLTASLSLVDHSQFLQGQ